MSTKPVRLRKAQRSGFKRAVATLCAVTVAMTPVAPGIALAGGLESEMNGMFNSMGVMGNVSAPGAFRGQTMNVYTGGDLQIRAPIRNYQFWSVQLPHIKAGCGGIDAFMGSFSFINKAQFKAMLQQVGNNTVGLLFQSALASINPLIASKLEWLQNQVKDMGNFNRSSCQLAESVVGGLSGLTGMDAYSNCIKLAKQIYGDGDQDAQDRCRTSLTAVNTDAKSSGDPNIKSMAGRNVNLVWDALANTTLSNDEKEMFLNIMGTRMVWNAAENGGNSFNPTSYEPSVDSLNTLLNGNAVSTTPGMIRIKRWLTCPDAACLTPVETDKDLTPFPTMTMTTLTNLRDKLYSKASPTSAEVGFVQQTSVPVYKMMAVGYMAGSGGNTTVIDTLIAKYAPIIAHDYAFTFLNRALRDARTYLGAARKQSVIEENAAAELLKRTDDLIREIGQERLRMMNAIPAADAMVNDIERTERTLRASLPVGMRNMIDFSNLMAQRR